VRQDFRTSRGASVVMSDPEWLKPI